MKLTRLILFILLLNTISVFGQTADPYFKSTGETGGNNAEPVTGPTADPCHKSTEGKDFWFGFMECRNYAAGHYVDITVTSIYECKYEVYLGQSKTPFDSGNVAPNTPRRITVDWHQAEAIGSEVPEDKAIHLVSDMPLNVYALSWAQNSADAAVIYPTESLGNEYYAMCYEPHLSALQANGNAQGRNSEFLIVATEDNTDVSITPTKVTDQLRQPNVSFHITLSKGELYQVQSENRLGTFPDQGDLTGSYITSNKRIALFSGSYCTTVPFSSNNAWDHLYDQIPPVQTWGRKFIAVPLKSREKDTYRILASENLTKVRIGNQTPVIINKGQFYEFMLNYDQASLIESDKPILLAQYSNSNSVDVAFTGGDGDPFMVIVSPVNQTREKVSFVAYSSIYITNKYFVNIIVKDDAVGKINLDNDPVSFQPITGTDYSYAQVRIAQGNHILESSEPGKGFIAYVYGFGGFESYGYGVGFNLNIVLDLGSNINATDGVLIRCDGADPLTLNAGNAFDHYKWSTQDTTSSIQINKAGLYSVKVSTNEGCILEDTVELKVSKPIVNLGNDTTICNSAYIVLDAGSKDQFANYLWTTSRTSLTDQKITVTNPGTYLVEATNKYECKARDTIQVAFTDKPKMNFSKLDTLICGKKSDILDVTADKGNFTVQRLSDNIIFPGLNVAVPDFGAYDLKIKASDQFTCYSDTVIKFAFRNIPTIDFSIDSSTCYHYNLNVKYSGNASATSDFVWVFGGDTINRGIGLDTYQVPLGINRIKRDLKLIVTDQGCSNDKSLRDIKVIPNLEMWVTDSLGCEPFTTQFMGKNTETVTYDWDFGDGKVLSGSTTDPFHTYQNDGYYRVKLKITTDKGCTNEVRIDSMVYVAPIPTAGFTSFAAKCLEKGNHEISYSGTGNQLDTYFWDLSKFDNEEIIQNPDTTQGPLIFNLKNKPQTRIRLNVISKYGCKSDTALVLVKRVPDFSIHASSNAGCTPFDPLFSAKTRDAIDLVNYTWDFGDGSKGAGDEVMHEYGEPDRKYNVILTALSATTNCFDTLSRPAYILTYPKPKAGFSMDHKIVYNDQPTVNFTNESTGEKEYLWNFGDKLTSDQENPSHYYNVTGYRTVLLEVFNEFLCSDTISHQLLVAMDRIFPPNAFSPNAPNVVDREYKLSSNAIAAEGYHLTILSRWNDIVFETWEEKGWDGHAPNGNMAPAGAYVWILNFTDYLGRRHRQTGTVALVY
ncbi:MAG: PKD domain-containing protein [Bacteroidia bacterium]|nr:PKD domain-containing protein [Bacteroidia bacterium]